MRTNAQPIGTRWYHSIDTFVNFSQFASTNSQNHMDPPSPARSRTSVATTSVSRVSRLSGVVTIDNFDPSRTKGPYINSPRSLRACALEGVVPDEDFAIPRTATILLQCGGDKEDASKRRAHLVARRDHLVALVRSRRARLIETEQAHQPEEEQPEERPGHSHPRARTHVEKIRAVMEANEKREQQKLEYIQLMRLKFEKQEEERAKEKVRHDEMKRREEAEAKERALTLRDEQLRREEKQRQENERKKEEMRRKAIESELEEEARQRKMELRRAEMALTKEERQHELRAKQEATTEHAKILELERRARLEDKLEEEAERLRELEEERTLHLQKKKAHHEELARIAREKKRQSEEKKAAAAEYTRMQVEKAMQRTEEFEKNKKAEWYYKTAVEATAEKKRIAAFQRSVRALKQQQARLIKTIEDDDSKHAELLNDRSAGWKQRKLNRELEMADKLYAVKRVQRLKELEAEELKREAQRKVERIEAMQEEARRLQQKRVIEQQELERIRSQVKVPSTSLTPGPQSYEVLSSEAYLRTNTAVTKIGCSGRPAMAVSHSPGPGHYNLPPARKARAALLPPRSTTSSFWKKHGMMNTSSSQQKRSQSRASSIDLSLPEEVTAEDRKDTPEASRPTSPIV